MTQAYEFVYQDIPYTINVIKCDHYGHGETPQTCMMIYGPVAQSGILSLAASLPLLHKPVGKDGIMWFDDDGDWIPKGVREYCDRLVKNKAFL